MSVRTRRVAAALGAVATTAVAASTLTIAPAEAAPAPAGLKVVYDAQGTTFVAKPKSTATLGPTTLTAVLNANTGAFKGDLPLPPTGTTFKVVGLVPVQSTINFVPTKQVTGKLINKGKFSIVRSKAFYTIKLTNVKVAGIDAQAGDKCQTKEPVVVPANTAPGGRFSLDTGGDLTGTFTIGDFADCGITTPIINLLVAGPGNTADITVSNGQIG